MHALEVAAGRDSSVVLLVAVAVATGMGCGGGLLLAVLGLVIHSLR